ncbi:MAG: PilZ domain-containing protein [Methylococcaceae bacterium]|nr:PilZ domain-containing protein [Methylococcaceae bacterium]
MPEHQRYYRKALTTKGLIYLAGAELEIAVKNFSVTGLLAELLSNSVIHNVTDLFKAIENSSSLVDIYLPDMRLAGEVRIARADMLDEGEGSLLMALEFIHIAYDIDAVFYKRKVYRKNIEATGSIFLNGRKHSFKTINVSVEGLMISLPGKIDFIAGLVAAFEFEYLGLLGEVEVMWIDDDANDGTLMGLRYVRMEKESIKGIPSFSKIAA